MKIYPRNVTIQPGQNAYELYIRNSASDDRVLLYKIRRSEQKVLEFSPKLGYVEPGTTSTIKLNVIDRSFDRTRLLVKLVVVKKSLLDGDFDENWQKACKRNGEVKKVIDIINSSATSRGTNGDINGHAATPSAAQRNLNKQLMLTQVPPSISRLRSTDSTDAFSDTSSVSAAQSFVSAGFYSPSEAGNLSPSPVWAGGREEGHRDNHDHDSVLGTVIHCDDFSVADSAMEDSADLRSLPLTATHHAEMVYSGAAPAEDRSTQPQALSAEGNSHTGASVQSADAGVLLALLQQLTKMPGAVPLLTSMLASAGAAPAVPAPPPTTSPVTEDPCNIAGNGHSLPQSSGPGVPTEECDPALLSNAERTRRFIAAEEEESTFPSVKSALDVRQQEGREASTAADVARCSRMTGLGSARYARGGSASSEASSTGAAGGLLLEVFGQDRRLSDAEVAEVAVQRLEEAAEARRKVVAIEVAACAVTDIHSSVGHLFQREQEKGEPSGHEEALRMKLDAMRAVHFEENLKHLSINDCAITSIDASVNRFAHLQSLNLSGNSIRSIAAPLQLPHLRSLDLSNNLLVSLDYLQLLGGLTTLIVASNRISSLSLSVNMLVSLSKTLLSLDMSSNPVCDDRHYAQEVVHVLPRLRFFDSFDLEGMGKTYSYSFRGGARPAVARSSSTPRPRGQSQTVRAKRLPDLPDEVRSVRAGSSTGGPSYEDRRKDFERRLCSALSQRSRLGGARASPPSPLPVHTTSSVRPSTALLMGMQSREKAPRGWRDAEGDYSQAGSDEESEMRGVEESIQDLSMSATRKFTLSGRTRQGIAPTSEQKAGDRPSSPISDGETQQDASVRGRGEADIGVGAQHSASSSRWDPTTDLTVVPAPALIQQWAHHYTTEEMREFRQGSVPPIDSCSALLEPTDSLRLRQQLVGVANRRMRFPEHPDFESPSKQYPGFALGDRSGRDASTRSFGVSQSVSAAQGSFARASGSRSPSSSTRGYHSESELGSHRRARTEHSARRAAAMTTLSEEQFLEMQESERYGQWHPRYRVPKPIFGFSRPFIRRHAPSLKDHAPLFDTTVQRMRDSFRKAPARGTFSRASKGLPGDWYPMDFAEVEAVRRQGYFHDTIGEVTKDSYRDVKATKPTDASISQSNSRSTTPELMRSIRSGVTAQSRVSSSVPQFLQEALVSPRGSVSLSPQKAGRRQTWGPHLSRFDPATSAVHAYDDFSQFRKWHQGLFDHARDEPTNATEAAAEEEKEEAMGRQDAKGMTMAVSAEAPFPPQPHSNADGNAASFSNAGPLHPQQLPQPPIPQYTPASGSSRYSTLYEDDTEQQDGVRRSDDHRPALPPLPADVAPLPSQAASERKRDVTLLQMDGRDSAELRPPTLSPLRSVTSSPPRTADHSFEEDRRAFDALPTFSEASSPTTASAEEEQAAEARAPSPSLLRLSAMAERIEAEEAELANYLSWLDSQQQQGGSQGVRSPTPPPATAMTAAVSAPKERSSGIPRYAGSRADGSDGDGDAMRVFSPRDAAMRAEQRDASSFSGSGKIGRSAFQSRTLFDQY